jgi:polyphosphate kinase
MPRNLDRRVELLTPVDDEASRDRLIDVLKMCAKDTAKARLLQADGTYIRHAKARDAKAVRSQGEFYDQACALAKRAIAEPKVVFEPQRPIART